MKRYVVMALLLVYCIFGCGAHVPLPFHYIAAPGGYSPIALKVYKVWIDQDFGEADKVAMDDAIAQLYS